MDVIKEQTVNLEKVLFAVESVAVQDGTNKNKNRDEKCLKYKHCYFKEILPKWEKNLVGWNVLYLCYMA